VRRAFELCRFENTIQAGRLRARRIHTATHIPILTDSECYTTFHYEGGGRCLKSSNKRTTEKCSFT
jgi:hypothetical protein